MERRFFEYSDETEPVLTVPLLMRKSVFELNYEEEGSEMEFKSPIQRPKEEYTEVIDKISLPNSPVGIDAQYTHAIIITYLQQIVSRLERIEKTLGLKE